MDGVEDHDHESASESNEEEDYSSVDVGTSDGVMSDISTASTSASSLLDKLHSPTPDVLARKRKLNRNPPKGIKRGKGKEKGDPTTISPRQRVNSYPNEELTVSNGKLFCRACREELSTKKSSLQSHLKSQKHLNKKIKLAQRNKEEANIVQALNSYDKELHPVGEQLPLSTRVHRIKVVRAMLKAGVPLGKIDLFRHLLEENAYSLTSSTHLRQLIPFILQEELTRIRKEIFQQPLSIIFDGTTHICEAFVIVLRYLTPHWELKQCVGRLKLLAKSMTGDDVAQQIIVVLSTELGITPHCVVAAMRDRASVNNVAMRTIKVLYNQLIDIGCFSHTIDHVGDRMNTPLLNDFSKAWIGMFSRSPKLRLLWRTQTEWSVPSYSTTRWWSRFEVIEQILTAFSDVQTFLGNDDLPPASSAKLQAILNDPAKLRKLKVELAITVDAMRPFVNVTYKLEGDGAISLIVYEQLSMLYASISTQHYPNVVAVAREEAAGNASHEQQLTAYARSCVQPAYSYFKSKFDNDLKHAVACFKAARYFSPSKCSELKPGVADIDSLRLFPFLDSQPVIDGLKAELPMYLAAVEDVSTEIDPVSWWKCHSVELPKWAGAFKYIILVQPSSAAAERVFSILQRFTAQQESSLEDYVELSVMLQYNTRSVSHNESVVQC